MTRTGQFFSAIFAKVTDEDRAYVEKYLNEAGRKLFFSMAEFDQAHAISTARTTEDFTFSGNREFLIRAALLHDVGRRAGDMGILAKVFCVAANAFLGKFAKYLSKHIHILYIYYNHPQIGAELLNEAGFAKEAELVLHHHDYHGEKSEALALLQKADNMN